MIFQHFQQLIHNKQKIYNGQHGHVFMDGKYKEFGHNVQMEMMLMLQIVLKMVNV